MPIIVNKQLELEKTNQYRLSIQADLNGFSFSIVNDELRKCHFLYQSEFGAGEDIELFNKSLLKLTEGFPLLSRKFAKVDVIVNTHKYALVPLKLFREEDAWQQLKQLHLPDEYEEIDHALLESQQIAFVFAANSTFLNIIKKIQPQFRVFPSIYPIIKNAGLFPEHNKIFVQYHKGNIHVIITEGTKLLFCNSYPAIHFNTALYFIFLALKQTQLNQEQTTLFTSGNFRDEEIYNLTKYFPKVRFFRHPSIPLGPQEIEMKYAPLVFPL